MTDKQIIGGRGSAKSFTTLNTVEVLLENEKLKEALKRKEQECEELKDKLNCCFCNPYVELNNIEKQRKCVEVTECFRRQLDQLKAENDKLKKELNKKYIREDIKTYCPFFFRDTATCLGRDLNEIGQLKFCNKYHNCWIKKVSRENLKLKQTLTEIKEIAEEYEELHGFLDCSGDLILQKISEVEDEHNG